jgi:hypothetical protein
LFLSKARESDEHCSINTINGLAKENTLENENTTALFAT